MTKYFGFEHESDYTIMSDDPRVAEIYEYSDSLEYSENTPLAIVSRNDESFWYFGTLKGKNLEDLREQTRSMFENYIDEFLEYGILELDNTPYGISAYYDLEENHYGNDRESLIFEMIRELENNIKDSYIDKDSGDCIFIINLMTNEVILSGSDDLYFLSKEDIDERIEEMND